MKKSQIFPIILLFLTGCDRFGYQPLPYPVWSPIPTRTPAVITATPIIFTPPMTGTYTPLAATSTETPSPTLPSPSETPSETSTTVPTQSIEGTILGCNTSFDSSHGMGEVTNAFIMIKNTGTVDLLNACALLRAIDEDREHPDKKACIPLLPARSQVTFKLTVDSSYRQDTAIQVDISSNDALLLRVDEQSCTAISLFGDAPTNLNIPEPVQ